jgi:4-amino-4-deoxy-L-arabinose transferase-like glycosyltransferase
LERAKTPKEFENKTTSGTSNRIVFLLPICIFVLAFLARFIYLLQIESSLPFFYALRLDELYHDIWAKRIASGEWFGTEPFFRAPLYVYLLALTYKIFGHSLFLPRLFQIVAGSLSCVLIFLIAKKLFNRSIAALSGVIACFYAMLILYDAHLLITSLVVFLDLVLIYLLLHAGEKPKPLSWFLCGAVLGLSAIARPNILVFVPFILLWMFFQFKSKLLPRAILTRWIILCAGALLVISPVTLRNYLVGKDFVLIAWQGGFNFYLGNNPEATGWSTMAPQIHGSLGGGIHDARRLAEKETKTKLKPSQISGYWYGKGVDYMLSQPLSWLELTGRKALFFWKGYEIPNAQNAYINKDFSTLLDSLVGESVIYLPFGLVGPLSILGLLICLRRIKRYLLLYLFILSYSATVIIFFVCSRYRMPVIPILIMFASFSVWWLYQKIRNKQVLKLLISLAVIFVLLLTLNTRLENLTGDQRAMNHFMLGRAYSQLGKVELAINEWEISLGFDPSLNLSRITLADAYFNQSSLDLAMMHYTTAILYDTSGHDRCYFGLAMIHHQREDRDLAIEYYLRSIEINPRFEQAHIMLGRAYHEEGLPEKAKDEWEKVLELNPNNQAAIKLLGRR